MDWASSDGLRVNRLLSQRLFHLAEKFFGASGERGGGFALPPGDATTIPKAVSERRAKEREHDPRGAFAREQTEFESEEV